MQPGVEFSFLNVDRGYKKKYISQSYNNIFLHVYFDLSQKIIAEKRTVTSLTQLFGDLGGLYEFVATFIIFLIGRYQSGAFTLHQVASHFRLPSSSSFEDVNKMSNTSSINLEQWPSLFPSVGQSLCQRLLLAFWPCCCLLARKSQKSRHKLLVTG